MKTKRKYLRFVLCALVMAAVLVPALLLERSASAYLTFNPYTAAVEKSTVAMDESEAIKAGAQRANVLFLLDVGCSMVFTPTGTMPEWGNNANTSAQANAMLRQSTYGHGGLDVRGGIGITTRMGREGPDQADADNNVTTGNWNIANHLNHYYSPFNYAGSMLATDLGIPGAPALPYALVFKNQAWWRNGPPGAFTKADLVPNDSRMYKMKLVMWRVLEDTVMLEKLRLGMATTFQELNGTNTSWTADYYKTSPFAVGSWLNGINWTNGTGPSWSTGLAGSSGYGDGVRAYWGIDRGFYELSHDNRTWKLLNRAYLRVPIAEYSQELASQFRLWLDGYENVAMTINNNTDKYYFKNPELFADGKTYLSTAIFSGHPDLSRKTIFNTRDMLNRPGILFSHRTAATTSSIGKADGNFAGGGTEGNYFKAGSGEALGTMLDFFSPPVSGIGTGVDYSAHNVQNAPEVSFPLTDPCEKNWVILFTAGDDSGDSGGYTSANAAKMLYEYTRDNDLTKFAGLNNDGTNKFEKIKLQDGVRTLVVGFVDPVAPESAALRTKLNAIAVAGDPGNDNAKAYFANDVEGLLNVLRAILARINSGIQPSKGSMLEVANLDDQSAGGENEVVGNFYPPSFRVNIYDQWEGALTRYETVWNTSAGTLVTTKKWELGGKLLAARDSAPGSRNLQYWAGNNDGTNFKKLDYTGSATAATRHPVITNAASNLNFTPVSAAGMEGAALNSTAGGVMDNSTVGNPTVPGSSTFAGKIHPSRALVDWYYGYEWSYSSRQSNGNYIVEPLKRRYMLADTGNSGVQQVGPLPTQNSLPGFTAFAASRNTNAQIATKLYFQTNDGLLHVVDAMAGTEERAILPPPSLLPHRLWPLKVLPDPVNGTYRWIDVQKFMTLTSDDIPISSTPAFTLDGPLQVYYFNMGGLTANWRGIMVATLGRGGGGLYSMDVTDPANPEYLWYHETMEPEGKSGGVRLFHQTNRSVQDRIEPRIQDVARGSAYWESVIGNSSGSSANPDAHPYEQLGFNAPKPAFAVTRRQGVTMPASGADLRNMIVLPGGMSNTLSDDLSPDRKRLTDNGKMGAALYVIDPDIKYHAAPDDAANYTAGGVKVFNSASYKNVAGKWKVGSAYVNGSPYSDPYMGMMISEPSFLAMYSGSQYIRDGILVCDNRGNIHYVSTVNNGSVTPGNAVVPLNPDDWEIRTVGTLRSSSDDPGDSYSNPYGLMFYNRRTAPNEMWAGGGTANLGGRDNMELVNKEQMLYCFLLPPLDSSSPGLSSRKGDINGGAGWTSLNAENGLAGRVAEQKGWYIRLEPDSAASPYKAEYVSAKPKMQGGNMIAATFLEEKIPTEGGLCDTGNVKGNSRIYALGFDTGKATGISGLTDKKYLEFPGIKITGLTVSEGKVIFTFADLGGGIPDNYKIPGMDNAGLLPLDSPPPQRRTNVTSNDGVINYWRYID